MAPTNRLLVAILAMLILIACQLIVIAYVVGHQSRVEVICGNGVECQ